MPSQAEQVNRMVKQRVISSPALSDVLERPEGEVEHLSAEAVEVLALLVALIWLSAWTGFWLHEAVRVNLSAPLAMNRFALAT
jgi:hypothetical protein